MADAENQNQHLVILDLANEPVVADTIFPELPQLGTAQGLPYAARILEGSQPLVKELQDALCLRWVDECPLGVLVAADFNKKVVRDAEGLGIGLVRYALNSDLKKSPTFEEIWQGLTLRTLDK